MIVDPVLAIIKAYRLRGDMEGLKRASSSRFDSCMTAQAKKVLWENCQVDLKATGWVHQSRRDSEKRSQVCADLDDLFAAFEKLDDADKLPSFYCEAVDLIKLHPIAVDPLTELVRSNHASLQEIDVKLASLKEEFSSAYSLSSDNLRSYNLSWVQLLLSHPLYLPPLCSVTLNPCQLLPGQI